jgi:hypothetical protein
MGWRDDGEVFVKRKNKIALAVGAVAALAACSGANIILEARTFAIGTWSCKVNNVTLTVGVKENGTALLRAPSGYEIPHTWKLVGTKLTIKGPKTARVSADFDLGKLDDGKISHTDTSKSETDNLIGGKDGSVSNVFWDFDEKIVSFEAESVAGVPSGTVYCRKVSDVGVLKPLPSTTTMPLPPALNSLKSVGAAIFYNATHDDHTPITSSIASWKKAFRDLPTTPLTEPLMKGLEITVVDEYGWTPVFKDGKVVDVEFKSIPTMFELTGENVAVCMKISEESRPLSLFDGACLS